MTILASISNEVRVAASAHAADYHKRFVDAGRDLYEVVDNLKNECDREVMSRLGGKRDLYQKHRAAVKERLFKIDRETSDTSSKSKLRRQFLEEAKKSLIDKKIDIEEIKRIRSDCAKQAALEIYKRKFGEQQDAAQAENATRTQTSEYALVSNPFFAVSANVTNSHSREVFQTGDQYAEIGGKAIGHIHVWNTSWMANESAIINEEHRADYVNYAEMYRQLTMPQNIGGKILVVIDLVANDIAGGVKYVHERRDMSGWSHSQIYHRSEVYFTIVGTPDARFDFIYDYNHTTDQDELIDFTVALPGESRQIALVSNGVYAAGQAVTLAVGVRNYDGFWANDMWCRSHMWSDWIIAGVRAGGLAGF